MTCQRCAAPLNTPLDSTCFPCRLELLAAILRLCERLAREIEEDTRSTNAARAARMPDD